MDLVDGCGLPPQVDEYDVQQNQVEGEKNYHGNIPEGESALGIAFTVLDVDVYGVSSRIEEIRAFLCLFKIVRNTL